MIHRLARILRFVALSELVLYAVCVVFCMVVSDLTGADLGNAWAAGLLFPVFAALPLIAYAIWSTRPEAVEAIREVYPEASHIVDFVAPPLDQARELSPK